jgi:TRAP transporter TAXI family solute receptor
MHNRIVLPWLAIAALAGGAQAQTYGFATLPPGSILHAQASVIAKVVQDHSKLQIRVIGYGGDAPMFDSVNTQKADFLVLDVGETADAYQGQGNWKGNAKPNLRTAITMYGFQMGPFVRKDSGINSIAELKGKRVPSGWAQQTGNLPHSIAVLAAGGLSYNDVQQIPEVNVVRAADDFKAGKLDMFFFAVGAPKVAEVAAGVGGLRYLGFTRDQEAKLKAVRPEYYLSPVNPAPHIAGVDAPTLAQTIDVVVAAGAHVKDEVVYEFVKAMREHKKELVEGHPNFNRFDEADAGKLQPRLPHHPGAVKYFKEAGIWRGK